MEAASPLETERVRRHTAPEINAQIDERIARNIRLYRGQPPETINARLEELEREWDIERVLETNAATLALTGVVLGAVVDRRWLALSAGVLGFLFVHGTQGWCPPLSALRRLVVGHNYCAEPDWSRADPKKIVFTAGVGKGYQSAVYDMAAGGHAKIVTKAPMDAVEPVWCADGRHIVVTFRNATSRALYLVDTESGKATRLSPTALGNAWNASYLAP
jgi:hypothetical protein